MALNLEFINLRATFSLSLDESQMDDGIFCAVVLRKKKRWDILPFLQ